MTVGSAAVICAVQPNFIAGIAEIEKPWLPMANWRSSNADLYGCDRTFPLWFDIAQRMDSGVSCDKLLASVSRVLKRLALATAPLLIGRSHQAL